jgi:Bacterial Ig domain
MGSTVYVGFAITSHSAVAYSTAYFTNVAAEIGATGGSPVPSPGNQPPSVSLTSPASGASFAAPATFTLNATASDPDGGVAVVDFYSGSVHLGSDYSSPYSFTVYGLPATTYSFTAVARDHEGAMTVSSERVVTVGGSGPKFAVFVPSPNQATAVNHYVLDVYAVGTDPYASSPTASLDLGLPPVVNGESRVDITTFVAGLPPGNYVATVIAIGSGGSAESAPSPQFSR